MQVSGTNLITINQITLKLHLNIVLLLIDKLYVYTVTNAHLYYNLM